MLKMFKIFVFSLFISLTSSEQTVKYAAIIYRHGDRTPVDPYPTDPWRNESFWPVKFGQLTNIGKRQHYALGQWLRKRYAHLLSDQFDPTEIRVRSTDVDRTLMSAQANLAGMYPPKGNGVWDEDLKWQPIPIHTKLEKNDELLAMKRKCIPYIREKEKYMKSKAYRERLNKYQSLMDYLSANTGKKIKDYVDIDDIYGVLVIESLYNFTLPNWTQAVYPGELREPACYSFSTATATPYMARLMVGPLLTEIVGNMQKAMTEQSHLKMSVYSGHDFTIGNILSGMRLYDGNCPQYTATVFFELVEAPSKQHCVRVSYRERPGAEPRALALPHCGELCPLERFTELYANLLAVDWEQECSQEVPMVFSVVVIVALSAVMLVVIKINSLAAKAQSAIRLRNINLATTNV